MPTRKIIERAIGIAKTSQEEFLVGAILYKGSSILRAKCNTKKYMGYRSKFFPYLPTRHAEVACMHQVPRDILEQCNILVVRVNRQGKLTSSQPCMACLKAMRSAGINKVYFSNYKGEIVSLDPAKTDLNTYEKERI